MIISPYSPAPLVFLPYDEKFPELFAYLQRAIVNVLPTAEVQHIGSTSIPGMGGKNILNLMVALPYADFPGALRTLEGLGFHVHPYKSEPEDRPLRVGVIEYRWVRYGVHVHVLEYNSDNYYNSIFFRDYLQSHPEAQEEYQRLKQEAVVRSSDPTMYNNAKQPFIRSILGFRNT